MKFLFSLFISVLSISISYAQEVEQGTMEFGIIDYNLEEGGMIDSTMLVGYMAQFKSSIPNKIYFNKDVVTLIHIAADEQTIDKRIVFDTKNRYTYIFDESTKQYIKDSITVEKEAKIETDIISRHPLNRKIFGFKVDSITYMEPSLPDTVRSIVAPGVTFDNIPSLGMFIINDDFIIQSQLKVYNLTLTFGLKSFSRDKIDNEEVFSTSLDGYKDGRLLVEAMLNMFEDEEPDNDPVYKGQGINLDKVTDLLAKNIIDTTSSYKRDMHKEWVELNVSFDNHAILTLLKEDGNSDKLSTNQQIIETIEAHQLMSAKNIQLLKSISSVDRQMFWKYIFFIQLKADFNDKDVRKIIVDNHIKLGIDNDDNKEARNNFLDGKIDYSQYITTISELLHPLPVKGTTSMSEVESIVNNFISKALEGVTDYAIDKGADAFKIKTAQHEYPIFYKDIRTINWEIEYNDEKGYTYNDTVFLNESFYNTLLTTVKQIDADFDSPYAYGIYNFDELIIDEYDALKIQKSHPELKIFDIKLCLNRFITEEYDVFGENPISFPHNNKSQDQQFSIRGFKIGDVDGNTPYVTTVKKVEFIAFLQENASLFDLKPDQITTIENSIKHQLLESTADLMNKIPNLGITLSVFSDAYHMNKYYEPTITENTNKLKDLFPRLARLSRGEFEATNFTFSKDPKRTLSFDYNNERYTIDASATNMLKKMVELSNENSANDNNFYKVYLGMGDTKYLYMTETQKNSLSKLLDISFDKM